jgi:hypothetical protein
MVILFLALLLLIGCTGIIGNSVAGYLQSEKVFDRQEDLLVVSIWIGIVILANVFLALSLLGPLSPPVSICTTTLLTTLALLPRHSRHLVIKLATTAGPCSWCGLIAISLGVAVYCSQVIVWYDSGLYHLQFIKWLSDVGIVPGMALIHWRLGIASSWFALAAPFNRGILAGRMFTLFGGFCLLMLLCQGSIAAVHLIKRQGRRQDLFMFFATLLTIPFLLVWGMPNSTSTDLPVICLEIVTAWSILTIAGAPTAAIHDSPRNVSLVLVILAAGATTIKLSAAPLLAVVGLYYLLHRRFSPGKVLVGVAATGLTLAPTAAAGLLISGCAFFPATLFCLDAPWSLGRAEVAERSRLIQDWAKWGGASPPEGATTLQWLGQWLRTEWAGSALIALTLVSGVIIWGIIRRRSTGAGTLPVVAIGLSGIMFMMATAPSWRFGLGYLILLPTLLLTLAGEPILPETGTASGCRLLNPCLIGLLVGLVIAMHSHMLPRPSYRQLDGFIAENPMGGGDNVHFRLVLPPKTLNIAYEIDPVTGNVSYARNQLLNERAADFTYFRPATAETSWDSPLPSTPYPLDAVALRNRQRGISGGFIRHEAAIK